MKRASLFSASANTEYVPCNLCGSRKDEELFYHEGFRVVRCAECGLTYVNPQNSKARLAQIYDYEYFENSEAMYYKNYYAEREQRTREFTKLIARIERYRKSGRLLDVGAAAGFLLDAARLRGWQGQGVEYSRTASAFAREELGLEVRTGELTDMSFEAASFDVVTMIDMLEHVKDPKANLKEAARILKPDGMLVLSTPNIGGWGYRIFKQGFVFMRPEVHLWYFETRTLKRILNDAGFMVLRFEFPYFDTPFFNLKEVWNLASRITQRLLSGGGKIIPSAPMRGNLINAFCVRRG